MHQIFLEIGPLTIRWYGVMVALGFLAATLLINLNRKCARMSSDQATALVFIAVICGIVGARIFYVIEFWSKYRENLLEVFRVDHGGLVFYGGFFLAVAGIVIFCRHNKLDIFRVMDVCSPGLAVGHALGRVGCFLNGCCYGKVTECFLGVTYPEGSAPFSQYAGLPVHPVQLYETAANLLLAVFLLWLLRRAKRGVTVASYIIIYGTLRFIDEFFRGDHHDFLFGGSLTPAQVIGLALIPVGAGMLFYFAKQAKEPAAPTDTETT